MVLKNPYAPLPRARSPLKLKVTYYEFLDEEQSLQTSCVAHNRDRAVTSTPSRLATQGSKSNKLESTGLTKTKCSRGGNEVHQHEFLLLLASHSNPSKESLKNGERGVRELFLSLGRCSACQMAREVAEGYGGVFIPLSPEYSHWVKGYPETPGISPETPGKPDFQPGNSHPDTTGNGIRSIRPYTRSIRVRQDKNLCFALLSVFCGSQMFVQVLLSTRFKSKPLNQVPLDSTASL